MLIEFTFTNFKAFSEEVTLSMKGNFFKEHDDHLITIKGERYSKLKIIYGGNASGKSSLIEAISFVKEFFINSNLLVDGSKINVMPFKFRKNCLDVPSSFKIIFIKNATKYVYSFSCTINEVISERLDVYYSNKSTNIFTRDNVDNYKFNNDSKFLNDIKTKNTKNKLFLVTAATWNYEIVKPVYDFVVNDLVIIGGEIANNKYSFDYLYKKGDYEEYKKFALKFLNDADVSIKDIKVDIKKIKETNNSEIIRILGALVNNDDEKLNRIEESNIYNFMFMHEVVTSNEKNSYSLSINEESLGTNQLFSLSIVLFYAFKEGKVVIIDEIDRSLHPLLVRHIINSFIKNSTNELPSQLIANTHETDLLDLEILRRDEIAFIDKNFNTGIASLYSLTDFSPRKEENIRKAYLLGRFGAIPFLKD